MIIKWACSTSPADKTAEAPVDVPTGWDPRTNQQPTGLLITACGGSCCSTPHPPRIKNDTQHKLGVIFYAGGGGRTHTCY